MARAHGSYPWCREFKSPFRYLEAPDQSGAFLFSLAFLYRNFFLIWCTKHCQILHCPLILEIQFRYRNKYDRQCTQIVLFVYTSSHIFLHGEIFSMILPILSIFECPIDTKSNIFPYGETRLVTLAALISASYPTILSILYLVTLYFHFLLFHIILSLGMP